MRIAFDVGPLLNGNKTGIGFYEHEIVTELIQKKKQDKFYFQFFAFRNKENKKKMLEKYISDNVEIDACEWFPGVLYRILMSFLYFPYHLFFKKNPDITHFVNFCIPPGVKGKKVVTIHDMTFKVYPETMRNKTKILLQLNIKKSIKRADKIIADSEFTKSEIQKYYNIETDKIAVVPCGIDFNVFHPDYMIDEIEQTKQKYEIQGKYFLYLGTLEPRKNLKRLILAFAMFCKKQKQENCPNLVLAGGKGWKYEEIFLAAKECGVEHKIKFIGYVPDEDVPRLMSGADVFCFPSLYEGFGMPPLEAMACGVPVLTSNCSSLAEVVGDAAITVDPNSVEAIAGGMQRLWENPELGAQLREKGLKQAQKYSWENAAEKLYDVYEELCRE